MFGDHELFYCLGRSNIAEPAWSHEVAKVARTARTEKREHARVAIR